MSEPIEQLREVVAAVPPLRDAVTVDALFSMIVRLADSLAWDVPDREAFTQRAPAMLEGGYAPQALGNR